MSPWWLLAAFAAGYLLRNLLTQRQLFRLGWRHAREVGKWSLDLQQARREAKKWAAECTAAWKDTERLEGELAELQGLYDAAFTEEARRELGPQ